MILMSMFLQYKVSPLEYAIETLEKKNQELKALIDLSNISNKLLPVSIS